MTANAENLRTPLRDNGATSASRDAYALPESVASDSLALNVLDEVPKQRIIVTDKSPRPALARKLPAAQPIVAVRHDRRWERMITGTTSAALTTCPAAMARSGTSSVGACLPYSQGRAACAQQRTVAKVPAVSDAWVTQQAAERLEIEA